MPQVISNNIVIGEVSLAILKGAPYEAHSKVSRCAPLLFPRSMHTTIAFTAATLVSVPTTEWSDCGIMSSNATNQLRWPCASAHRIVALRMNGAVL
jgi:hypothetical protein